MTRPAPNTIASGQQSWDADINVNKTITFDAPFPPVQVNDEAALDSNFPANAFDRCLAATVTPPGLWYSNGSKWIRLAHQQPLITVTVMGTVSGTSDDATINSNFTTLNDRMNLLKTRLENAGILDS